MKYQMKKEIKRQWVAALRSGKYRQAWATMYDPKDKSFCCLGVLEHVVLDGKVEHEQPSYEATCKFLPMPSEVFKEHVGVPLGTDLFPKLAVSNDFGESFETIANWISKNVKGV